MLNQHLALAEGSRIEDFEIRRRLGRGGFGVTYLATEYAPSSGAPGILREVAIKEFFPQGIAIRVENSRVIPSQMEGAEVAFFAALKAFLREAQAVARLDHANLIRIFRVFESHGTAYFAMPYVKGGSLRGMLRAQRVLDQGQIERLVLPVLDGLEEAHRQNILHRDLKPDNVMIRDEAQSPILIDFGAARIETSDVAEQYTRLSELAAYTPGYAPIEQYARAATANRHGPFTDIYAFCAMLYECITGKSPPEASLRSLEVQSGRPDPMEPASRLATFPYDSNLLASIDWGLEIIAGNRPQTVAQLRDAIHGLTPVPPRVATTVQATRQTLPPRVAMTDTVEVPASATGRQDRSPVEAPSAPAGAGPAGRRWVTVGLALGAALGFGVATGTWLVGRMKVTDTAEQHAAASIPSPVTPAPEPALQLPPPAPLRAWVRADQAGGAYTEGDPLRLEVTLNRPARVAVFQIDSGDRVRRLFPRTAAESVPFDAGELRIPGGSESIVVGKPAGASQIAVVASVDELVLDPSQTLALESGSFSRADFDRLLQSTRSRIDPAAFSLAIAPIEVREKARPVDRPGLAAGSAGSGSRPPKHPGGEGSGGTDVVVRQAPQPPSLPVAPSPSVSTPVAPRNDDWILNPSIPGGLAATGCVGQSGNTQIERNAALARARADLVKQLQTEVATLDQTLEELNQSGNEATSGFTFQSASSQIAQRSLSGVKIVRVEPATLDGQSKLCAMVALDGEGLRRTASDAARTAGLSPTPDVVARLARHLAPR